MKPNVTGADASQHNARDGASPKTPLPRGSEQSREDLIEMAMRRNFTHEFPANEPNTLTLLRSLAEAIALLSTAHAEGLGKGDYGVQTHVEPQHCTGWRTIDSAPSDGTAILAASINHEHVEVVCWQDGLPSGSRMAMDHPDEPEEGWVNNGALKDRFYANPRWFTHWMPLPAPPSSEAQSFSQDGVGAPVRALSAQDELSLALARQRELETERDEARAIVALCNNSLFGSCGYFTEASGVTAAQAIEGLKARSNGQWRRAEAAETRQRELEEALRNQQRYCANLKARTDITRLAFREALAEMEAEIAALLSPPTLEA